MESHEYEADQRHAVTLTDKNLASKDRPADAPGGNLSQDANEPELGIKEEIRSYNYMGMDRLDLQFSAKEVSRATSRPTRKDQHGIARLATYLKDPRNQEIKQEFEFESLDDTLTVHTDSD